ncbi:MAG: hypothetical protein COC05_06525 [Gammaproteobacteria bacterium]|nr:MAG: hypothetical protein COC05_06525 [Gammaproteobacteria bacterium]
MLNHSSHIDESQHPMMVKRIGRLLSPGPSFNLYYESAIKEPDLKNISPTSPWPLTKRKFMPLFLLQRLANDTTML